jgi:hypothetical protein
MAGIAVRSRAGGATRKSGPDSTPPARSSLDYSLDAIERNFRNTASGWRKQDLTQSAANLQWFLDGTGGTRFISREEARGMEPIRDGEQVNTSIRPAMKALSWMAAREDTQKIVGSAGWPDHHGQGRI